MPEKKSFQPKQLFLSGLFIFLVALLGFQIWYMMSMKQQLDNIQNKHDAIEKSIHSTRPAPENNASENNASLVPTPSLPATKQPAVEEPIQTDQNTQTQSVQPSQARPVNPPSLFDNGFFNQPNAAQSWNPYADIERMQRDMDRHFNNTFRRYHTRPGFQYMFEDSISTPKMDVQEDDSKYYVIVNLPGADEKNISVNLNGQRLTVRGEQNFGQQKKDDMGNVIYQERHSGSFQRSITLPQPVKQKGLKTQVRNGVLTITILKMQQRPQRRPPPA